MPAMFRILLSGDPGLVDLGKDRREFDGRLFDPATAPIPPFEDCTHPNQCACLYQARLELD